MSEPKIQINTDELVTVIDDLHSVALELGAESAYRFLNVLGFGPDDFPSGAELRARLREVLR
jgi:hypothetical protein